MHDVLQKLMRHPAIPVSPFTSASGWETFLSYEDPERDILVGLLRLRKCSDMTFRPELLKDGQTSIVRELHGKRLDHGAPVPGCWSVPRH